MTFVTPVSAIKIDIEHYVKKIKEHEEKRLSFNERMEYWKNYAKNNK